MQRGCQCQLILAMLLMISACRTPGATTSDQRRQQPLAATANAASPVPAAPTTGPIIGAGLPPLPSQINVDATQVIRSLQPRPLGINVNDLQDHDGNRSGAVPLTTALQSLGVHFLRYPGGEKSDWQFWSAPPWTSPKPQVFGWYSSQAAAQLLDFDTYMGYVRQIGGEPYIVVGYDSVARTSHALQEYLDNATNWVRYANVVKGYGIKYWEIGNENWNNSTATASEMAAVVTQFAQAMKRIDPSIKVGTSGLDDAWWRALLPVAGPVLDFLVISNYPSMTSYSDYLRSAPGALSQATATAKSIMAYAAPADQQRLTVIATEFNAMDWTKTWPDTNDLAHALINVDTYGQLVSEPKLETAMFWTTRWMNPQDAGSSVYYALDAANKPTAQGLAVGVWGQFLLDQLVSATSPVAAVVAYASHSVANGRQTVFLINKEASPQSVAVASQNLHYRFTKAQLWTLTGQSLSDTNPLWQQQQAGPTVQDNRVQLTLPPNSVSVVDLTSK